MHENPMILVQYVIHGYLWEVRSIVLNHPKSIHTGADLDAVADRIEATSDGKISVAHILAWQRFEGVAG